jgi:hypothetical protein
VHKNDTALSDQRIIESTGEKLVVSTVDGVTALEGNDILVIRELGTDFGGGLAREITGRKVQSSDLSSHVVLSTLGSNHQTSRVLQFRGSVDRTALHSLVGLVLVSELDSSNGEIALLEHNGGSRLKGLVIGIKNDGKTENGTIGKSGILHNAIVSGFVHESSNRRESTVHDKFDITKLTVRSLNFDSGLLRGGFLFGIGLDNKIDQSSSMGDLLGSKESRAEEMNSNLLIIGRKEWRGLVILFS